MPNRKAIDDQDGGEIKRHTSSPLRLVNQQYRPDYAEKTPFIKRCSMGKCFPFCTIYKAYFPVSHGGEFDVKRQVASVKHARNVGLAKNQTSVTNHFVMKSLELSDKIAVVTSLHISIAAADHFGDLLRAMFPGNRVATKFSSGRTKTTANLKTLATDSAAHQMTTGSFIIGTDCSQEWGYS